MNIPISIVLRMFKKVRKLRFLEKVWRSFSKMDIYKMSKMQKGRRTFTKKVKKVI